jgi:type II secretory pathway pseudopilin PulG
MARGALRLVLGVRAGFTLLEIVVALGLCILLMAGVYSAMHFQYRYSTAGRAEIEQARIARALLQRIELDLRSVVYRRDESTEVPSAEEAAEEEAAAATSTAGTSKSGLFGTADTLMFHASRPQKLVSYDVAALSGVVPTAGSDQQVIAYFVSGTGGGSLDLGTRGLNDAKPGLARMAGDRMSLDYADQQGDVALLESQTQVLATEVTRMQFRYYDGYEWFDSWDSTERNGLPRCVEILIEMEPSEDQRASNLSAAEPQPKQYRLVVPLMLSTPYDPNLVR